MIPQGYPLWAVESDGRAYAVVGWDEYQFPFLLLLDAPDARARNPIDGEHFTFTTTDPRNLSDMRGRVKAGYSCPCGGDCDTGDRVTRRETTVCVNGTHAYENGGWSCTYAGPGGCAK